MYCMRLIARLFRVEGGFPKNADEKDRDATRSEVASPIWMNNSDELPITPRIPRHMRKASASAGPVGSSSMGISSSRLRLTMTSAASWTFALARTLRVTSAAGSASGTATLAGSAAFSSESRGTGRSSSALPNGSV